MRKFALIIGIVILVLVAAVLIFAATFNVNHYRRTIQSQVQQRLVRPVSLGQMSLGIFPPRFRVQNVAIGDDPTFNAQIPFVRAQDLAISVKLLPLLRREVQINSVTLDRPDIDLIRNKQGVWNFQSLGKTSGTGTTAQPPQQPAQPAANQPAGQGAQPGQQFSLAHLIIRDGQVSVLDQQTSTTPSKYDHIDLSLGNFAPGKTFTIDAAAHLSGSGSEEVRLKGDGGPIVQNQPAATPFHGTLDLKQVGIADLAKFLNSPVFAGTDGILSGQTKIDSNSGNLTATGESNIQNAKVRGVDLGYPITATYDVTNNLGQNLITMRNVLVKLGSMPIETTGTINGRPTPAQLDLTLKTTNASLAELARLSALSGTSLPQGTNVTGNLSMNVQASGAANNPALNGTVTINNAQASGPALPQPVQVQTVQLNLTPSQIQSNPFNVTSGQTTMNTQFTLRNYTSPSPNINATAKATNAQLPAILAMAKAYGVKSLDKVTGSGTLNMDMHASGPVKQMNAQEITRTLNGTMNLNFANVKYSGADIGHELGAVGGFLGKMPSSQGVTNIQKMTGDVAVKNGIAQTNNLQAQLDIGTLGVVGTANLADETLNMHGTAVLSQGFSQSVGGNNVGGFMQTAMANNQHELVIPVLISGTFANPKFTPDAGQFAQMKLKGLVPSTSNPGGIAGTVGSLVGGAKNASPGQQQQPNTPAQNPAQQIMGIFNKKK